jgi:hypothetical protein
MKKLDWRLFTELAAALSIVLGLIFVGLELRQSSTVARLESYHSYVSVITDLYSNASTDPNLAELVGKASGNQSGQEFEATERVQLYMFYMGYVHALNGLFVSVKEEVLPESYLSVIRGLRLFDNDYFRGAWNGGMRDNFEEDFVAFFMTLSWNNG